MRYSELAKKLRAAGCYDTGRQSAGHPIWYSPISGSNFLMSNHHGEEVATGTLNRILKDAGLK